jgi:hypothetical protein
MAVHAAGRGSTAGADVVRDVHPDAQNRRAARGIRHGQDLPLAFGVKIACYAVRRMRSARTEEELLCPFPW